MEVKKKYKFIIENLVFSGGGLRGLAFIGAYKFLQKKHLLKNLKAISGCSAGSIIGFLININIFYKDLIPFITEIDFEELQNFDYINFINNFGIEKGIKLIDKIKELLKQKNININITFKELYELTNIKLYINTICLNDYEIIYNSVDNNPDMEILTAIRMSIAIPFVFTPVEYNNKLYIDGGLVDNIPVSIFNESLENTLVIKLEDNICFSNIDSIDKLFLNVFGCVFYHLSKNINETKYNIINIKTDNITSLIINPSLNIKTKLFNFGFNATKKYYYEKLIINNL